MVKATCLTSNEQEQTTAQTTLKDRLDGRQYTNMDSIHSPAKVVLLAVEYAKRSDVDSLYQLVVQHDAILETNLVLRILLTFLPETTPPHIYTRFLQALDDKSVREETGPVTLPAVTAIDDVTDRQAAKRVRKLHLRKLSGSGHQAGDEKDSLTAFLFQRAYALDEEAGMLSHVTDLLVPFVGHAPAIRTWLASTVIPLCRRNLEYHPQGAGSTLKAFQGLSDRAAVEYLLSQSGDDGHVHLGRDLRGLLAPWIHDSSKWICEDGKGEGLPVKCPGWEAFREWLVLQSSRSWLVASGAVEQWGGPRDVDFGYEISLELNSAQLQQLERGYVKAILASISSIAEPTLDALSAAWDMLRKARNLLGLKAPPNVYHVADSLPGSLSFGTDHPSSSKSASTLLRSDLLDSRNGLTEPNENAIDFLQILTLTAYLLTRLGIPYTIKKAGDLILRRDAREQKSELVKLVRLAANQSPKAGDEYWTRVRNEVLWLHSPGLQPSENDGRGAFGTLSRHSIEAELLKAMLSQSRMLLLHIES